MAAVEVKTFGTYSMAEACALLGVSDETGYRLCRAEPDEEQAAAGLNSGFPVAILRMGRCVKVPVIPLNRALGLEPEQAAS